MSLYLGINSLFNLPFFPIEWEAGEATDDYGTWHITAHGDNGNVVEYGEAAFDRNDITYWENHYYGTGEDGYVEIEYPIAIHPSTVYLKFLNCGNESAFQAYDEETQQWDNLCEFNRTRTLYVGTVHLAENHKYYKKFRLYLTRLYLSYEQNTTTRIYSVTISTGYFQSPTTIANEPNKIYIGDADGSIHQIDKVYLGTDDTGSTTVFSSNILPYQQAWAYDDSTYLTWHRATDNYGTWKIYASSYITSSYYPYYAFYGTSKSWRSQSKYVAGTSYIDIPETFTLDLGSFWSVQNPTLSFRMDSYGAGFNTKVQYQLEGYDGENHKWDLLAEGESGTISVSVTNNNYYARFKWTMYLMDYSTSGGATNAIQLYDIQLTAGTMCYLLHPSFQVWQNSSTSAIHYVAVGKYGRTVSSSNLQTWTTGTGVNTNYNLYVCGYHPASHLFVASGAYRSAPYCSADGISWFEGVFEKTPSSDIKYMQKNALGEALGAISDRADTFYIIARNGNWGTIDWSSKYSDYRGDCQLIEYPSPDHTETYCILTGRGAQYAYVYYDSQYLRSFDKWGRMTNSYDCNIACLGCNDTYILGVNDDGNEIYYTADERTWTLLASLDESTAVGIPYRIICHNGHYILLGNDRTSYSDDGVNWFAMTGLPSGYVLADVIYTHGIYLACGIDTNNDDDLTNGIICYSLNGTVWENTPLRAGEDPLLYSIAAV